MSAGLVTFCVDQVVEGGGSSRAVTRLHTMIGAPPGGAAAAAPEGGALAGPLAPTSTSTRWALVTP
jgi:hypothetical protein